MPWVTRVVVVVAIVLAVTVAILHVRTRLILCDQYEPTHLLGLSRDDVKATLGAPQLNTEGEATWVYQHGMDPEAFVHFEDGRVIRVEFLLWRCPPFSFRGAHLP